jgi:hypothetical protein
LIRINSAQAFSPDQENFCIMIGRLLASVLEPFNEARPPILQAKDGKTSMAT